MEEQKKEAEPPKATEWKKTKFKKQKRTAKRIEPPPAEAKPEVRTNQGGQPRKTEKQMYLEAQAKKGRNHDDMETVPLFDCMYCVGIHEHLALQTIKERKLTQMYGDVMPTPGKEAFDDGKLQEKTENAFMVQIMAA